MKQNTSHAVMAQRHEDADSLDYFPTPLWATRALCEELRTFGCILGQTVWEPACGGGHMVRALGEYFGRVIATDVNDYGWRGQLGLCDFTDNVVFPADWVITNPPFNEAEKFILKALAVAEVGVAMLTRTTFIEGQGRYKKLFSSLPPTMVLQFSERVPMFKGRVDPHGSTATAYCWSIWHRDGARERTILGWIPPCRERLERPGDYD